MVPQLFLENLEALLVKAGLSKMKPTLLKLFTVSRKFGMFQIKIFDRKSILELNKKNSCSHLHQVGRSTSWSQMFWHQFHPCVDEQEVFVACPGTRIQSSSAVTKAEPCSVSDRRGRGGSGVFVDEDRRRLSDMPKWLVKKTNLAFSD